MEAAGREARGRRARWPVREVRDMTCALMLVHCREVCLKRLRRDGTGKAEIAYSNFPKCSCARGVVEKRSQESQSGEVTVFLPWLLFCADAPVCVVRIMNRDRIYLKVVS